MPLVTVTMASDNGQSIEEKDSTKHEENTLSSGVGEFERSSFGIHLRRQAQICCLALNSKYKYLPESVSQIGQAFEDYIFNPQSKEDKMQQEARLNFYPPFLIPECTARYNSFFSILYVPYSCAANRTGSAKLKKLKEKDKFDVLPQFNEAMFVIADGLGGEVTATDSLQRNNRLVNLDLDYERLRIVKDKLKYVTQFAYPALNFPPKIHKELLSSLYKKFQTGKEEADDVDYIFPNHVIAELAQEKFGEPLEEPELLVLASDYRKNVLRAIQYVAPLKFLQSLFRHPGFVKKIQEILHYTFHHGFIRLLGDITKKNLSDYVTFHGMTFENHNNNPCLQTTLDLNDGEDYMADCIYLFLVMTVQTVMGIWQQNVNNKNLSLLSNLLKEKGSDLIFAKDVDEMADKLVTWITDNGQLIEVFQEASPDFISQTQLQNFRSLILARSNIASCIVPVLPRDFVPIDFKESPPRLWSHVYLLQLSYFFYNHGDYYQTFFFTDSENKVPENEIYCHCNLCAPHRSPAYNIALHNEISAIGTFDFFVPEGKSGHRLTLSPGMWANKYLDHFVGQEFFPFEVKKYIDFPELFKEPMTACVITKPQVLSSIQSLQRRKEKFLLEKGSGNYLDPQTGDLLCDTKLLSQSAPSRKHHAKSKLARSNSTNKAKEEKENTR